MFPFTFVRPLVLMQFSASLFFACPFVGFIRDVRVLRRRGRPDEERAKPSPKDRGGHERVVSDARQTEEEKNTATQAYIHTQRERAVSSHVIQQECVAMITCVCVGVRKREGKHAYTHIYVCVL